MFHLKLNAYGINLLTVLPVNAGGAIAGRYQLTQTNY